MVLFQKLCPVVPPSDQDGHHNAVAFLLKAALIQVSDYRLLGASGLHKNYRPWPSNFLWILWILWISGNNWWIWSILY